MKRRAVWILGFTLFSLFFGAGNLILPPQLGFRSGSLWWLANLGFCISAVAIPMLGILAHARLQGGMIDFAHKVSPAFSLVYCCVVYAISLSLPAPRTASVTHEMAVAPYFGVGPLFTSLLYFGAVFIVALNRSRLSGLIGKWLTPVILLVLVLLIGNLLLDPPSTIGPPTLAFPFTDGVLEGYQTFDAIGAVVAGGVILVSLRLEYPSLSSGERFRAIVGSAQIAGASLLLLYAGLMVCGALMNGVADPESSRTGLLTLMIGVALGSVGGYFLSLLIALACFTTAVGVVTGSADFVKSRFGDSKRAYQITALAGCVLGVGIGQLSVDYIIAVALPALMFIYPLTIVLIGLNALPPKYSPPPVFRAVVFATLAFSIPDFLGSLGLWGEWGRFWQSFPLTGQGLGWLLPAGVAYAIAQGWRQVRGRGSLSTEGGEVPEK